MKEGMFKLAVLGLIVAWSCKSRESNNNTTTPPADTSFNYVYESNLLQKADSLAREYIKFLKQDKSVSATGDTVYVSVEFESANQLDDAFVFTIYCSSRPQEDTDIPFKFVVVSAQSNQNENRQAIFFYADEIQFNSDSIRTALKKEKLIIELENGYITGIDPHSFNDFMAWHCIVCKNNLNKIKIIESPGVPEKKEIPLDVCD